jgi:lysophospholipid acyltransferase (LPLAT)-like uncharacterized protein
MIGLQLKFLKNIVLLRQSMFKNTIQVLKASLARWLLLVIRRSCRWKVTGSENYRTLLRNGQSFIFVCWHGGLLAPFIYFTGNGYYALAGMHRDANLIAHIGSRLGWKMLRGSSVQGGSAAYQEVINLLLESGNVVALTPDGPRGPAKVPKAGAIRAAKKTGVPIIPLAAQANRRWEFTNWDTFYVPKPFARIELAFGESLKFDENDDYDKCITKLKTALDTIEGIAMERADG